MTPFYIFFLGLFLEGAGAGFFLLPKLRLLPFFLPERRGEVAISILRKITIAQEFALSCEAAGP